MARILSSYFSLASFFLLCIIFLAFAFLFKIYIIKIVKTESSMLKIALESPINAKNPFIGFKLIIKSKYLLFLSLFILLLTSVSTFLYMEQARIIKELFPQREARIAAFANIDLVVQTLSFFIQIFLTAKIAKYFGLSALLGVVGFVLGFGFIILAFTHPTFCH
ncbi:putative inner membrane protein [Helicobacter fennelliae MRY12-0050]|uniref:Putative inner membrane protein n=1 Tax=Helicobacter fennelliae MRY12-0050 TaxID=1325130 RepID=T1CXP0_9HELI|nr:putative inner membrane protein [Helicobacter fennelliae MRY12-0050]